ncbi:LysE family translocator [Denitrificimonas caeni]|uniref:LysE family translocator n=1 Tax=Denitrificimonas caeni TaxID=521720 RepID=UPI0019652EF9|nr:LysE family transporter [Denitrificimonas caeni]
MELSTWLVYISVISVLICSPGPSAVLCMSNGLQYGNKKTIPTILGGAIAALLLMTISAVGLGAVLVASETLFFLIKIIGALYLVYLGWTAWQNTNVKLVGTAVNKRTLVNYSFFSLFQKGFMVGISNPKDLLFFIALFPSFMSADLPQIQQYVVLACTWFVIDCTSMFMYARLGSKISPWLAETNRMNLVNRSVGSLFIVLGSALAISTGISKKI